MRIQKLVLATLAFSLGCMPFAMAEKAPIAEPYKGKIVVKKTIPTAGKSSGGLKGMDSAFGGQDSSGGNSFLSTEADVRSAIDLAWQLMTSTTPGTDEKIFTEDLADDLIERLKSYGLEQYGPDSKLTANEIESLYTKVLKPTFLEPTSSTGWIAKPSYLKLSKLYVKQQGSCSAKGNLHADGSVSARQHGAVICMSLQNLRKVSPGSLNAEVLSLLAHEMTHLNGYGEVEARFVQNAVFRITVNFMNAAHAQDFITKTDKDICEVTLIANSLMRAARDNEGKLRVINQAKWLVLSASEMASSIDPSNFPVYLSNLYLEAKVGVRHYRNLTTAATGLKYMAQLEFQNEKGDGGSYSESTEHFQVEMARFSKAFYRVAFLAFPGVRLKCANEAWDPVPDAQTFAKAFQNPVAK